MNNLHSDPVTNLLNTFLDVQSRRAEITAGNIANSDTPGYVAKELNFDQHLRDAVKLASLPAKQADSMTLTPLETVEQTPTAIGLDGNTVDVGQEMATLAKAGSNFNFGVKMLQSRMRLLRAAIREGR